MIGTESVRTLVLSVHVFSQFETGPKLLLILPALWEHSMASARWRSKLPLPRGRPKV